MRRFVIRSILATVAALLIAANLGRPTAGSVGGFGSLLPYLLPGYVELPDLSLYEPSTDLEFARLWLIPSQGRRGYMEAITARKIVEITHIALWVQDLETNVVWKHGTLAAADVWRPVDGWDQGLSNVPTSDVLRFYFGEQIRLPPGRYSVWVTVYADPPHGAGVDAQERPPHAHLSLTVSRPWLDTYTSPPLAIEVDAR